MDALRQLPGVLRVTETSPAGFAQGRAFTHRLLVRTGQGSLTVFASLGSVGGEGVDNATFWLESLEASGPEQQVLTQLGRRVLADCFLDVTPAQLNDIRVLEDRSWLNTPHWNERVSGAVTFGWGSGPDALTIAGREVSGLSLHWPGQRSRCTF